MDFIKLLETSVVTGGMGTVLFYLNSKAHTDNDLAVLGMINKYYYFHSSFMYIEREKDHC
jgi:hypothetical protein